MKTDDAKILYPRPMTRLDSPLVKLPATERAVTARIKQAAEAVIQADIQPYLGLPARVSLVIMSLPLLSLLLSLSQLLSANRTAQSRAEDAKAQILATCKGVEEATNWLGNGGLQRVMAAKVNEGIVVSVQGTLKGLRFILIERFGPFLLLENQVLTVAPAQFNHNREGHRLRHRYVQVTADVYSRTGRPKRPRVTDQGS